jgi:GAF domain-containing protein
VPYLRCPTCGVASYLARGPSEPLCPECGVPVPATGQTDDREPAGDRRLDRLLQLTRELIDTDLVLLTEIRDGRETVIRSDGRWPGDASWQEASIPLEDTFCQRMLDGRIGNYVTDAQTDPRVHDLALARHFGVRAWLGTPIQISDARLYVLCCLAREARPSISDRDIRLLVGLAESVRARLESLQS